MKKSEFISALQEKLCGLPSDEVRERITFYSEMIDDRIEEGLSETQAVADIGPVNKIASQIISEIPLAKIAKGRLKPQRRLAAWEIVLIALGSPLWISLAVAAISVVISLYACLFSVILSFWAAFAAISVSAPAGLAVGLINIFSEGTAAGLVLISAGFILAGLAIFAFLGCLYATRGSVKLTRASLVGIKKLFIK